MFSLRLVGAPQMTTALRNAGNLLIGKFIRSAAFGLYAVAYRVLSLPATQIAVSRDFVVLPTFAYLKEDPDRFRTGSTPRMIAISQGGVAGLLVADALNQGNDLSQGYTTIAGAATFLVALGQYCIWHTSHKPVCIESCASNSLRQQKLG